MIVLKGIKPISKKNRLKFGKGRCWKPLEVSDFESALSAEARCVIGLRPPETGEVSLTIVVTMADKRKRDLQNFSDTICDALNGVLYVDDSQIVELHMFKKFGKSWEVEVSWSVS